VYTIQVIGGATQEDYTLTAKLAQSISFAPGASSISLNGTTTYGYVYTYDLSAQANQTLSVSLNVPASSATLDIFEPTTNDILLGASKQASTWTGVLPQTGDYMIEVIPNNGQVVDYSLTVSVH